MNALRILIVALVQTLALGYMIVDRQAVLNSGRVVTLKVAPVDPRDPLRGEYVILTYDISRLDTAQLEGDDKFQPTDTVFVTLLNRGEEWTAAAIARRPVAMAGGVVIKGTVKYGDDTNRVSIDYGIESFFVPQGQGREIENERQKGDLHADIVIDPKGRAMIKALRRKDQVIYVEGIL
jgi:uncharacterized membrane-anchored protein